MIKEDEPKYDSDVWTSITPKAKHLVVLLLEKNPAKRPNIVHVLRHPWFSKHSQKGEISDSAKYKFRMNLLKNQRMLSKNICKKEDQPNENIQHVKQFTFNEKEDRELSIEEHNQFYFSM